MIYYPFNLRLIFYSSLSSISAYSAAVTVIADVPDLPSAVAVIVADPVATPVTVPSLATVAIFSSLDL